MKSTIGERDKNETESSNGQSCTQEPKVYRYITDRFIFNLIDTPGIGDTRGVEADIENMKMVLKCLSNWNKIHGICILLKPNVPRLTISLRYCIEELLVNLHKNSIPNISVVFTNSCNTLYRPGDTMTVLKKLLDDVKDLNQNEIKLTGSNTFCIDNEAVRLLYAHQKGAEFEKDHIKNFSKSWKHTVNETYRLFEYISGLSPHFANETKATTHVRGTLTELSTLLAEMNDQILQNEKGCENQTRQLEALKSKLAEKQKQNSYEAECIENTPMNYPVTVCCGPNCIETVRIPNSDKQETFHKRICCSQCPLTNVAKNQIGEPNLRLCTAFGSNAFCQTCGCSWQTHMHIWYSQKRTTSKFSTHTNAEEINHLNLQIDAKSKYIAENEKKLVQLQKNYNLVFDLCHPYFEFLQQNSIIPLNSAIEEYLKLSIEELEKVLQPEDDRSEIESLQKLLAIQQQQKLIATCKTKNNSDLKIDFSNYTETISNLKNHETIGQKLKESASFQKLFETFESKVVEITPILEPEFVETKLKKEEGNNEAAENLPGKISSKRKP
uniref:G domain-containing protein n=1 Tax=Panagrolaimus davidi TaxID=227884 RepID=A0A914P9G3_9BILA